MFENIISRQEIASFQQLTFRTFTKWWNETDAKKIGVCSS